jgi:DNA polymerase-3 subunit delta'
VPLRDIVQRHGHRRIAELLARSTARGALPPSLIFAGPPGSGTRETAIALAQLLNCLKVKTAAALGASNASGIADTADACGSCAACEKIVRGVHPDVLLVEPGDNGSIKIDQIRDVVDRSGFRPFEGRRRVVVIDVADAMAAAAQNALLKTLEEPTPSSVFILVTARPDVLLPTVRSRCVRLAFAAGSATPIDPEAVDVATRVLAQSAAGPDGDRLEGAKALLEGTGRNAADDRVQVATHLRAMATVLRDIEAIATRAGAELVNADFKADLERLVPAYQGRRGVEAFGAIDRALLAIERNSGVKVVADWVVLQL